MDQFFKKMGDSITGGVSAVGSGIVAVGDGFASGVTAVGEGMGIKPKSFKAKWACEECTFENEGSAAACVMCKRLRDGDETVTPSVSQPAEPPSSSHSASAPWKCERCTFADNPGGAAACEMCSLCKGNPAVPAGVATPAAAQLAISTQPVEPRALPYDWLCPACTLQNHGGNSCAACGTPPPTAMPISLASTPTPVATPRPRSPQVATTPPWTCVACTFKNERGGTNCGACDTPYAQGRSFAEMAATQSMRVLAHTSPGAAEPTPAPPRAAATGVERGWICRVCTFQNGGGETCEMCGTSKPSLASTAVVASQPTIAVAPVPPAHSTETFRTPQGFSVDGGRLVETVAPPVIERREHDSFLCKHLVAQATPAVYKATAKAAAIFQARAILAKRVVFERQQRAGEAAGSDVALPVRMASASAAEREHEAIIEQMSREEKIAEGLKLLHQRTSFIEVQVLLMEDDGNCQFRALAHELHGDQRFYRAVRAKIIAHLRSHSADFQFYVGGDVDWQQYLAKMALDRTWGDELTLRAASEAYRCQVHVVTTEKQNWLLHYGQDPALDGRTAQAGLASRHVFLAYVSPIHYNVIGPLPRAEYVRRRHAARVLQRASSRRQSSRRQSSRRASALSAHESAAAPQSGPCLATAKLGHAGSPGHEASPEMVPSAVSVTPVDDEWSLVSAAHVHLREPAIGSTPSMSSGRALD
mmetsp:Transcript_35907/g.94423  ORF Transcript_35907/g.94423 Transcript_35907/m.94423 type:complete len:703 (+) Transcript_35907:89-2197(+)|eukprot:CAMPEP_0115841570 /NCGR_PEP_ID=MMETSP0287-20121206/7355_1 /TAXON_ID=412157 /ORGANISM="Chrysochromulina rotalis, Strain UIO044" /LENGTH=702 /DNA_ID=CAMNT_0003295217 /DNA_START=87 /DNA_END=2195 /DNA_ORIENTATION=-